ncbi:MAG: hypothetical protein AAGA96_05235 [Verrucomicrobiota bacterium]
MKVSASTGVARSEDPVPVPSTAETQEQEQSSEPSNEDELLHLKCPKCDGELVIREKHLGVDGACVWCHAPIVAARSGVDGTVRIFPVFQPGSAEGEPLESGLEAPKVESPEAFLEVAIQQESAESETAPDPEMTAAREIESVAEVDSKRDAEPPEQHEPVPEIASAWGMPNKEHTAGETNDEAAATKRTEEEPEEDSQWGDGFVAPKMPEASKGSDQPEGFSSFAPDKKPENSRAPSEMNLPGPLDPEGSSMSKLDEASSIGFGSNGFENGVGPAPTDHEEAVSSGFGSPDSLAPQPEAAAPAIEVTADHEEPPGSGWGKPSAMPGFDAMPAGFDAAPAETKDSLETDPAPQGEISAPAGFSGDVLSSGFSGEAPPTPPTNEEPATPISEVGSPASAAEGDEGPMPFSGKPENAAVPTMPAKVDGPPTFEAKSTMVAESESLQPTMSGFAIAEQPSRGSAFNDLSSASTDMEPLPTFGTTVDSDSADDKPEAVSDEAMGRMTGPPELPKPVDFVDPPAPITDEQQDESADEASAPPTESTFSPAFSTGSGGTFNSGASEGGLFGNPSSAVETPTPEVEAPVEMTPSPANLENGNTQKIEPAILESETAPVQATAGTPTVTSASLGEKPVKKRKVRKGFIVLMVIIVGFVCGAALASYVLPVDEYVVKARALMEQKFNPAGLVEMPSTPAAEAPAMPADAVPFAEMVSPAEVVPPVEAAPPRDTAPASPLDASPVPDATAPSQP